MKLQIGTIAYREVKTGEFKHARPLYAKATEELLKSQKELMFSACDMFSAEIYKILNKGRF